MKITPKSKVLIADCETNGFLDQLDCINLLTVGGLWSEDVHVFRPAAYAESEASTIEAGLRRLMAACEKDPNTVVVFHNAIRFDYPALRKAYPWFEIPRGQIYDSLVWVKLKYPDVYNQLDAKLIKSGKIQKGFAKPHSLEAWGQRVGQYKGEYRGDTRIEDEKERWEKRWDDWNPDLEEYGIQDVVTLRTVLRRTKPWQYSAFAQELEHRVYWIIQRQVARGFAFNEDAAVELYAHLKAESAAIHEDLETTVSPRWWKDGKEKVPKRNNKTLGYIEGAAFQPIKLLPFNPTSRRHIARVLKEDYGWKPKAFTETGDPQVDDDVLSALDYPIAKKLARLFLIEKRIGMLAEGNQAWLKLVRNGRIHGDVDPNGAQTGRMTHKRPNTAQVPRVGTEYGEECRSLFTAGEGYVLCGADADGLELRMLAHYLYPYDDGAYAEAVVSGNKEDETDVHSINTKAIGLEPKKIYTIGTKSSSGRDFGKTFIYAFLYGAGPPKLGSIIGKGKAAGLRMKNDFFAQVPAIRKLVGAVHKKIDKTGGVIGLDGRFIPVRAKHAGLNTLLQGGGACLMKVVLVLFDEAAQAAGFVPGVDYEFVANVHDEFQWEALPEHVEALGEIANQSFGRAGELLGVRCAIVGTYKSGRTWADTH